MKQTSAASLLIATLIIVTLSLVEGQLSLLATLTVLAGLAFLGWLAFPTRYAWAVAPVWTALLLVGAVPVLVVAVVAFFQVDSSNMLSGAWRYVGLDNLQTLFADPNERLILARTIAFAGVAVVLQFALGIPWGLLIATKPRLGWMEALLVVPITTPPIVTALLMRAAFDPGFGGVSALIAGLGQTPPDWFAISASGGAALLPAALAPPLLAETWQWTPFVALTTAVSLRRLSPTLISWSRVTAASLPRRLWLVFLPQIAPVLLLVATFRYLDSIKTFESIWIPFGEGVLTATAAVRITTLGLQVRDYSAAAALSLVLLVGVGAAASLAARALLNLRERSL